MAQNSNAGKNRRGESPAGEMPLDSARGMPKAYDPAAIEPRWAREWVAQGLFTAATRRDTATVPPDTRTFSLVIPPPNVTGSLHMGHMLQHTQIDALMRWRRMQGCNTLWLPGTDHAGIATQLVVERLLAEQGIDRKKLGREEFEQRVWEWKEQSGDTIKKQMVRLGVSCDWTRERFTLEPALYRAVIEAFVRLFQEGLIYRDRYIINWCPRCQTAISDLEVAHEERDARLYYFRYPLADGSGYVVIATTRPETMLGDTGVAVHPEDARYKHLVGKKVLLPLMNRELPIIADAYVDPEFGTGAVKVTPAHDPNDFLVGQRHGLAQINIMDDIAQMNENAGPYAGLDRFQARKRVLRDLEALGLVEQETPYRHALGLCHRCKTLVEPRVSLQWFCRMKPLAEPAIRVVEQGLITFTPENWAKVYFDWMRNIHDWCISRQLWWGHRIPIWHCADCGQMTAARVYPPAPNLPPPEASPVNCPRCGSPRLAQDPDVLDTWFSSALWPFSTLGWPDDTADLRAFYPTTLMITGFDILFFWVARMIMMGVHLTGKVPFSQVYIHQLVRDAERQKMSKTRGNVIDPLEVTERYGTDAVRFTLAIMSAPGTDIALSEDRMRSYRAFANKIWNAARFIFLNLARCAQQTGEPIATWAGDFPQMGSGEPFPPGQNGDRWQRCWPEQPDLADQWIYVKFMDVVESANQSLAGFRFHEACHQLYHFFWHDFCDWYLEWVKPKLFSDSGAPNKVVFRNLLNIFEESLRLLHPFMPFITEELWQRLPHKYQSIALAPYPQPWPAPASWELARQEMELLQQAIVALRNIRAEMKIDARRKIFGELAASRPALLELFRTYQNEIVRLANLSHLELHRGHLSPAEGVLRASAEFDARVPFSDADPAAEINRLRREKEKIERLLTQLHQQLENQEFLAKAPQDVVRAITRRQAEYNAQYQKVVTLLAALERQPPSGALSEAGGNTSGGEN